MRKLLTPELEAMVGTEVEYTAPEPLGRASIRYFASAIGDENPIYVDDDAARAAGHASVVAPPTLICETNQYAALARDGDGYAGHSWDFDVPGTQLIRGGNRYEFHQAVVPSDRITARWRLVDMTERAASDGSALLLVASEARYVNQHSQLLAVNRETTIFKEARGA